MPKATYVLYGWACVYNYLPSTGHRTTKERRHQQSVSCGAVPAQTVAHGAYVSATGESRPTANSIIRGLRRSRPTARVCIVRIVLDKLRRGWGRVRVPFRPAIRIVRRLWVRPISHHSCRGRGRCHLRWWAGIELMRCMRWDECRRGGTCAQRRRPRIVGLSLR